MQNKDMDILVISAQPDYMRNKLTEMGYAHVSVARTQQEALTRLNESPPALMMLDYRIALPGLSKLSPDQSEGTIPGIVFTTPLSREVDINLLAQQHAIAACHSWDGPDVIEQLIGQALQKAPHAAGNLAGTLEASSKWRTLVENAKDKLGQVSNLMAEPSRYTRDGL